MSVELRPVALIFAIAYAALGLIAFFVFAVGNDNKFVLPLGIVLPLFHLNLNFPLARASDPIGNVFLCLGANFSYTLTGWITGIASALGFNFIAEKVGGIPAKYVSVVIDENSRQSAPTTNNDDSMTERSTSLPA